MSSRRGAPEALVMGCEMSVVAGLHTDCRAEARPTAELHRADRLQRAAVQLLATCFRLIRALFLQAGEVARRDIAGDVTAREARIVELLDVRVVMQAGAHQVV